MMVGEKNNPVDITSENNEAKMKQNHTESINIILKDSEEKPSSPGDGISKGLFMPGIGQSYYNTEIGPHNFKKIKLLGTGLYGKVYLVKSQGLFKDGIYAMKVMNKIKMLSKNRAQRAMTEKDVLAIANHPFIVTLYCSFQTAEYVYMILQYCPGGEFFNLLQKQPCKRLSEKQAQFYSAEVLLALEYLHLLGIIYRDLKPENILVDESGHLMLTDFDLAMHQSKSPLNISPRRRYNSLLWYTIVQSRMKQKKYLTCCTRTYDRYPDVDTETHLESGQRRTSFVGTHEYIAPEIVAHEGYAGSIDWWAFGILIYEMLFGKTPFKGKTEIETLENILDEEEKLEFPTNVPISKECKDLLKQLLNKDSKKRLQNPVLIRQHPFYKQINWALIRNEKPPILPKFQDKDTMMDTSNFINYNDDEASDDDVLWNEAKKNMKKLKYKSFNSATMDEKDQAFFNNFEYVQHGK